ncbi:hypothetical protein PLICRDRAFT_40878 [Plicaturopsis crispa FD-325 SS-3]|nr:hypothetical protein PLICRDRAFT_40878 [Plicaturopsis crispa FD-325 SS-3]
MILGRICRLWRAVALATPRLWTALYLDLDKPSKLPISKLWLSRTGGCPLTLHAHLGAKYFTVGGASEPVLQVLMAYSPRWQSLTLQTSVESAKSLSAIRRRIPLLHHLKIRLVGCDESHSHVQVLSNAFEHAPALRNLNIEGGLLSTAVKLPWAQITCIYVASTNHGFSFLFQHLPSLRECVLDDRGIQRESLDASVVPSIQHSALESLVLLSDESNEVLFTAVVEHLTLPNLRELVVDSRTTRDVPPSFASFLARSKCPLDKLSVRWSHTSQSFTNLIAGLAEIPSLSKLNLAGLHSADCELISSLTRGGSRPPNLLLPNLRSIKLHISHASDGLSLVQMLRSRFKSAAPYCGSGASEPAELERVRLFFPQKVSPQVGLQLRALRREGLAIEAVDAKQYLSA